MIERTATCSCGRLSLRCKGEPIRVSICHCFACQRRTGSAFGTQARYAKSEVAVRGTATTYVREGESGASITFFFCPTCATTVYWDHPAMPDFLLVAVGAFADLTLPAPSASFYEERQHPWTRSLTADTIEHIG